MASNRILSILVILLSIDSVYAARVGLVVEFPNNAVFMECVEVEENANAYEILQESSLKTVWSLHPQHGHGLCAILDTGCPAENCFCSTRYWNLHIKKQGENSWSHSPVGFDGGSTCSQHYCAKDGDMVGFTYNIRGEKPGDITFKEICPTIKEETLVEEPGIVGRIIAYPTENAGYISAGILFILLIAYFIYKPWEYF
jgi:hypothetical protein